MLLVQQGDTKAITLLYSRYAKLLLRYFHRMLWKDESLAQDFLHDLFVKVIEKSHQYKPDQRFSTWLYSAAHNMCKNEYRKRASRKRFEDAGESMVAGSVSDAFEQKQFREALDLIIDAMEEDDKNLFVLRHELEMTVEEISKLVKIPEGTVKSRLFYLKKKLATRLHMFHMTEN
jgi:RNA polymerase sigma-70 factor, ECF subfamily